MSSSSVITQQVQGLATATSPGLVGTGAQTWAGKKTLDGGALIKGDTSGGVISSGYVGEVFGSASSTASGAVYYVNSTTSVTASASSVCSITVNKGIYFCSFQSRCFHSDGASTIRSFLTTLRINGTAVTPQLLLDAQNGLYVNQSWSVPIVITADSTVVAVYSNLQSMTGSSGGNQHMLALLRIG